jgi:hypothetical protein
MMPLDGGQILRTVLFSRTIWLETFFLGFSLIAMLALGVYFSEPLLFFMAIVLLFIFMAHFSQRKLLKQLRDKLGNAGDISHETLISETLELIKDDTKLNRYPFQKKFKIVHQIITNFSSAKASIKTTVSTLVIYAALLVMPTIYIVLPILRGQPLSFLNLAPQDPCEIVRTYTPPQFLNLPSARTRFQRIPSIQVKPDYRRNTVFRYCFQVLEKTPVNSQSTQTPYFPAADTLARMWALFGKPDIIENGFSYTFKDQTSGFVITLHCQNLVPVYFSKHLSDEGFAAVLYLFEKHLQRIPPADCEMDITLDYSKYRDEIDDYEYEADMEPISHYKIGAKEGKPFLKYQQPANQEKD